MKRQEIRDSIKAKKEAIQTLEQEINELHKDFCLLSDEEQWFTEEMETVKVRKNGKLVKEEWLVGKVHWKQDFKCEDTGNVITIDRCQVVRVNGKWEW